ncbi:MAG: tyrosine-type recombinase/integrase [Magnetococcales bacterium]|nr:tyrosine-type recombinase/integrase [Magnetococcales bacterium]MBF0116940.1 tyrosine-type recombinase/integrase [Magnetococcales bacterium]
MTRFTDRFIQNLEVKPERYDVRETDGFAVRIAPSGTKAWQFIYTFEARKRRVTLGIYPGMGLKEAREACNKLRACLDRGVDPVEWQEEQERQAAEAKRKEEQTATIAQLVEEYLERWAKPRKRTWPEDQRMLNKDVLPRWGKRKAKEITRHDVVKLLDEMQDRGATTTANRTLACVRKMFNFAVSRGVVDVSPCLGVQAPVAERQRDRVLTVEEIRAFWNGLDKAGMDERTRLALKLQFLTATRKGEVVTASWNDFDLAGGWWTIPVESSKNKLAHRIPLSSQALAILERIKALSGDSPWLFPSRIPGRHVTQTSIDHALRKNLAVLGVESFTPHDLRRTAASLMTGMGISRLVVSKILNHVERSITAVYDRHGYDTEKRMALDAWGRRLESILAGKENDNVVPLRVMA